jgi:hypothetical protein
MLMMSPCLRSRLETSAGISTYLVYVDGVCRSIGWMDGLDVPLFVDKAGASALDVLLAVCRLTGGLVGMDMDVPPAYRHLAAP